MLREARRAVDCTMSVIPHNPAKAGPFSYFSLTKKIFLKLEIFLLKANRKNGGLDKIFRKVYNVRHKLNLNN